MPGDAHIDLEYWYPGLVTCQARQTSVSAEDGPVKTCGLALGPSAVEYLRLRTLADFELGFQLWDGSEGSLRCHRALLAQNSHVIRCVREKERGEWFRGAARMNEMSVAAEHKYDMRECLKFDVPRIHCRDMQRAPVIIAASFVSLCTTATQRFCDGFNFC